MAMPRVRAAVWLPALAMLASCGGDTLTPPAASDSSTGTATTSASSTSTTASTWVSGQFAPEASFAEMCAAPRTGTDPVTHQAYTDVQGTALDEKNWLRSWTNDLYLWYDEVVDQDPATFSTDAAYFAVLKTEQTTASGAPKDKFHFTYPTTTWEELSQSATEPGYGANFVIVAPQPPRDVVVAYTEPGSAAATAPANLLRGAKVLAIDGADAVNATDQTSIDTLNAGLSPQTVGETHTFSILDPGASAPRAVTLVSANVQSTPVQGVTSFRTAAGDLVGYLLYNEQLATAESELVDAFTTLKADGVKDLILDIRYDGGGYLDIASEVAYMIAGPTPTTGQTFELTQFNGKHPSVDPVTGETIVAVGFHSTTQGFSTPSGQALPTLNLPRVFVLTTSSTCSASESIINSLQGVNVQVIQIGSTTCGKPYGFYPTDNCGVTYFSIQFQGVNAKNFGAYSDGFTPANTVATQGVLVPGCSVNDDFTHALGDPAEGMLAAGLSYQSTGVCPVPPASIAGGTAVKSLWRENRLYRRPMLH